MLMKKHFFPKTLIGKLIFTLIIMAVYLIGRELPLYGVDLAAYDALRGQSEDLIMQTIGGDRYKTSLFALGISPFMFSTLFIQMAVAFKNADSKSRTSPKKITWATLGLMVGGQLFRPILQRHPPFTSMKGDVSCWLQSLFLEFRW